MEKTLNTAIIGFGLSGRLFHAPFLHTHPGFMLKKVVERHSDTAKALYPHIELARDYKELLNDDSIDLVVIASPNIYHAKQAKDLLLAGKNVVIEKPLTPASSEADELIQLEKTTGKQIFVYQNRRWDGDFKTVQQVIYQGYLGELMDYEANWERFAPGARRSAWRDEPLPAGGVLYDLGSHLIDQAVELFGMPKSIFANLRKLRPGTKVDDCFEVHLFYQKLKAVLKASVYVKEKGPRYILHGTKGSFVKYGIDPQEEDLKQGLMPDQAGWGNEDPEYWGVLNAEVNGQQFYGTIATEAGNYMGFYNNVYDVLVNKAEKDVKTEQARNVIRLIELAFESDKKGAVIPVS